MSKIILITGSSTGLGAETARFLAFQLDKNLIIYEMRIFCYYR